MVKVVEQGARDSDDRARPNQTPASASDWVIRGPAPQGLHRTEVARNQLITRGVNGHWGSRFHRSVVFSFQPTQHHKKPDPRHQAGEGFLQGNPHPPGRSQSNENGDRKEDGSCTATINTTGTVNVELATPRVRQRKLSFLTTGFLEALRCPQTKSTAVSKPWRVVHIGGWATC